MWPRLRAHADKWGCASNRAEEGGPVLAAVNTEVAAGPRNHGSRCVVSETGLSLPTSVSELMKDL